MELLLEQLLITSKWMQWISARLFTAAGGQPVSFGGWDMATSTENFGQVHQVGRWWALVDASRGAGDTQVGAA